MFAAPTNMPSSLQLAGHDGAGAGVRQRMRINADGASIAGGVTVVAVNAANEPKAVELAVPVPGAAAPVHLALGPWEVRVRRLAFGNGAVYV